VAQEGGAKTADTQNSSSEGKESRSTSRTSRFNDSVDGRKGRKGKKGRTSDKDAQSEQNQDEDAEKVKEAAKPVILTEALPPAVNPWAKRMEAHKVVTKPKEISASPDGSIVGNESKQGSSQEEADVHDAMPNGTNGDKKKPIEASRPADQAPRRSGPRGSRASDKDEKSSASFPPAADSSSWPDPKAAAVREQPSRKTQEKIDTAEKDSQDEAGPTRKKTWEKLEIVHSVVFETHLPPLRGSKPRGGARGGRDAGSMRGNAANAPSNPAPSSLSDKATPVGGSTGPKPAATRPQEGSIPARSTSQPQSTHASKRASIDGATREQRKPSVPGTTTDQARDQSLDASYVSLLDG
jgi:la-related protein 1